MIAVVLVVLILAATLVACGDNDNDGSTGEIVIRIHDGDNVIRWDRNEDFPTIKKDGYHIAKLLDAPDGESIEPDNLKTIELTSSFDIYIVWAEHEYVHVAPTQPTCTEPGYSESERCYICNEYRIPQTETAPPLGHDYVHYNRVEPTCVNEGREECDVCSRCVDYNAIATILATIIPATGVHIANDDCKCVYCGAEYHENVVDYKCEKCNATAIKGKILLKDLKEILLEKCQNVQIKMTTKDSEMSDIYGYYGYDENGIYLFSKYYNEIVFDYTVFFADKNLIALSSSDKEDSVSFVSATKEDWEKYHMSETRTIFSKYSEVTRVVRFDLDAPIDFICNQFIWAGITFTFSFDNDYSEIVDSIDLNDAKEAFFVTLDANGGEFVYGEGGITYTDGYKYLIVSEIDLSNYKPEREGYSFLGWFEDAECTIEAKGVKSITQNTTLYAGWRKVK